MRSSQNGMVAIDPENSIPIQHAINQLRAFGYTVIVSVSSKEEVQARLSCGQLWSKYLIKKQYATVAA